MGAEDDRLRQMIREFGRALSEALSDSSEAHRSLREIREEGYTFYLLLGNLGEEDKALVRYELPGRAASPAEPTARPREAPSGSSAEPSFRINGNDLAFLRSIGIDPTRKVKRRRGRS